MAATRSAAPKRRRVRLIIAVCAVAILLCCGGLTAAGITFVQFGYSSARDAVAAHADALAAGDYAGSYHQLRSRYRSSMAKDDYIRLHTNYHRKLQSYEIGDIKLPLRGQATATITLTDQTGTPTTHVWPLAIDEDEDEDEDEIRVCFDPTSQAPQY